MLARAIIVIGLFVVTLLTLYSPFTALLAPISAFGLGRLYEWCEPAPDDGPQEQK